VPQPNQHAGKSIEWQREQVTKYPGRATIQRGVPNSLFAETCQRCGVGFDDPKDLRCHSGAGEIQVAHKSRWDAWHETRSQQKSS
jgi:hypothetical protein